MNKREAILKSVLEIVDKEGFYHLNMKKIASLANVAAGTIYLYFKGKEELINALYAMIVREFNEYVLSAYEEGIGVKENFMKMIDRALHFYITQPDRFSFVEQYTYAPFLFKENQEENFLLLLPIYKLMRMGKEQGLVKDMPDVVLLSLIHGPLNTIIKLHLAKKTDMGKQKAQQIFYECVWNAISTNNS